MSEIAVAGPGMRVAQRRQSAASGVLIMAGRSVRLSLRNLDALLTSLMLPVMLMLLFVYLFGGAVEIGVAYVTYVVPGVMLLCAGFGASLTAVSVSTDMKEGIIDRFRSMDISGVAVLAGHVSASVLRNLVSTVVVLGVAMLIGFRPDAGPLDWLAAAGMIAAFILALSWFSAAVGLLTRSPEAAGGFGFFIMFLPYPSSAFVPVETMPGWIHGFAENQPVTPMIESVRALLLSQPIGNSAWQALAWWGAILLVSIVLSGVLFRRRTN